MNQTGNQPDPPPVIAIDGPAGAGKSTVARALAHRLHFFLLDTGAIYRSLALLSQECGVSLDDGQGLARLAASLPVRFGRGREEGCVFLSAREVTEQIRAPEVSLGASRVSSHPDVRLALLSLQRRLAQSGPCVVEGRDVGTVVLPEAPIKLFLTASREVRAQRRHEELLRRGVEVDLSATRRDQEERDRRDETRAAAPLRQAEDAILVDTSELPLSQVIDQVEALCRRLLDGLPNRSAGGSTAGTP
jgi:cytidylate kinase